MYNDTIPSNNDGRNNIVTDSRAGIIVRKSACSHFISLIVLKKYNAMTTYYIYVYSIYRYTNSTTFLLEIVF